MREFLVRMAAVCSIAAVALTACNGSSGTATQPTIISMLVPASAEINQTVPVSVTATDPQGLALTYQWSCPIGVFDNPTSAACNWTAPATGAAGVVITVRVTNSNNEFVTGTRTIDVLGITGSVTAQVRTIVNAKCATCHVAKPAGHTGGQDIEQCGACHIPYGNTTLVTHTAVMTGCTGCHSTVAGTHYYLRDDNDQTILKADAVNDCISCHRDGGIRQDGRGRPALDTDAAILEAARNGSLRSWIQPGGFMAKYLTPSEITTLTNWVDSMSQSRVLGYDPYLDATQAADFTPNGAGSNAAWNSAAEHVVHVDPTIYTATNLIRMKALYSASKLYIRVQYDDATLSMTRSGSWFWTGTDWRHPVAASDNDKQSEDRVSIIWNQTVPNFRDRYGCAFKCHGNVPGSACFTDQTGATADIWHTKAARAMGVFSQSDSGGLTVDSASEAFEVTAGLVDLNGALDDKRVVWFMDLADGFDTEDSGRRGDSGTSAYSHNRNSAKTAPKYMETDPDSWSDAMVLTQSEIDAGLLDGSVIVADPAAVGYSAPAVIAAWANYTALEAIVPERILRNPAGSRGDVTQYSRWSNGVWTNVYVRALQTGNADDVQFVPSAATEYPFSIAIFDNCGRGEIPPGHTTYGDGQYQILRFN